METARAVLASVVLAALAAQAFVAVVDARAGPVEKASQGDDVKKPDCVPGMDPRSFPGGITPLPPAHGTPPSHGGGGYVPTPSHGGSGPVGPLPTPAHGGSGSGGPLPTPAHGDPTAPSTGSSPSTPSQGGGAYGGGGGGGFPAAPSHGGGASPTTPAYGGGAPSTPSSHGTTTTPMPSVPVDPHSPSALPGSCDYWRSHPMEIWSAISGRFPSASMGSFLPGAGGVGGSGTGVSIQDALGNTRSDGTGALLREGAAALLNSITRAGFPYTTQQVRDAFAAAAAGGSDGAAAAQAAAFKKANEGTTTNTKA